MPKKSKKRARQAKRRAERREVKRPDQPEPTPAERLLRRIHHESLLRREGQARLAQEREADLTRRLERDKARGKL